MGFGAAERKREIPTDMAMIKPNFAGVEFF
jgi:hypothetical protein